MLGKHRICPSNTSAGTLNSIARKQEQANKKKLSYCLPASCLVVLESLTIVRRGAQMWGTFTLSPKDCSVVPEC